MISKKTKILQKNLLDLCSKFKCSPYQWDTTGKQLLIPIPEIWKFYVNIGFICFYSLFLLAGLPKSFQSNEDVRILYIFVHLTATVLFILICGCMCSEFVVQGNEIMVVINQCYFTFDIFSGRKLRL